MASIPIPIFGVFHWRGSERESFIDNLLVRIHFITVMIEWTGLASWQFEFWFPGSLTSTFLSGEGTVYFCEVASYVK